MKWEKALKYTRKHKRMIAVMMAGVIGFACFYSADASVIKDAKKKKNEAQQNLDNINQQINNIQSEQSKVKSQMAAYDEQLMSLLTDMELLKRILIIRKARLIRQRRISPQHRKKNSSSMQI